MLELLQLPPVWKGLVLLVAGGFLFPVTGVYIVRMNLLSIRFMMMHSLMLGGAIALAADLSPVGITTAVNVLLVFLLVWLSRSGGMEMGRVNLFLMILSIGLASILMYAFHVPAKDTMNLLWGSPFTVGWDDFISVGLLGLVVIVYQARYVRQIRAVFFDPDIAFTSGVNESAHTYFIVGLTALAVAAAMKLMGAFLMDALILLPAIIASSQASSMKSVFRRASFLGEGLSLAGFFAALLLNWPVSGTIAVLASIVMGINLIKRRCYA